MFHSISHHLQLLQSPIFWPVSKTIPRFSIYLLVTILLQVKLDDYLQESVKSTWEFGFTRTSFWNARESEMELYSMYKLTYWKKKVGRGRGRAYFMFIKCSCVLILICRYAWAAITRHIKMNQVFFFYFQKAVKTFVQDIMKFQCHH